MEAKIFKAAVNKAKAAVRKYKRDLGCVEAVIRVNFPSLDQSEINQVADVAFAAVPVI